MPKASLIRFAQAETAEFARADAQTGVLNPSAPAMLCGQNRSARENKRKREISRDFSRFFAPAFFRSFIDPFCPFRCCVRTWTHEKGYFAPFKKQSVPWLDSDLRKRNRTVRKSRRFTNCLQTHLFSPQIVRIWTHEIGQTTIRYISVLQQIKTKMILYYMQ